MDFAMKNIIFKFVTNKSSKIITYEIVRYVHTNSGLWHGTYWTVSLSLFSEIALPTRLCSCKCPNIPAQSRFT